MNRLFYILLISAVTITGFSMYKQNDLGHISFSFANFSFETNLLVFGAALLSCLFVVLLVINSYLLIKNVFVYFSKRRKQRLKEKVNLSLSQGLIKYAEGRFEQAEKILLQQVERSENRLLIYLSVARAAQQLGAHDRRDEYLYKAQVEAPDADIAIGLTKAELQLAHNQNEQALATLRQLNIITENHPYVLTLLANTYKHLQDWDNLKNILPALKKHSNLSTESFLGFEIMVCNGQLSKLATAAKLEHSGSQALISFWSDTPEHLKTIPDVTELYARQLIFVDAAGEAENILRLYLNQNWQESTIILYAELDVMVDSKQLEIVESWLNTHQQNAYLLLALGKMCIHRSLWGKARSYLEASITINPMPQNHLKLARLLEEHMEEAAAAQEYYRQGLHLLAGDYGEEVLNKEVHDFEHETPQLKIVKI
jgi:HemY protein